MARTISIITFYNPSQKNLDNMFRIAKQSDITIICDNSETVGNNVFKVNSANIFYYRFYKNLGLSAAFNRVLKDESFNWNDDDFIVFFDQDSVINETHIATLEKEYCKLEQMQIKVGCLGPAYYDTSTGAAYTGTFIRNSKTYTMVYNIMASSMLCRYINLRLVNFWNERAFLDIADWDLCWRMRKLKLRCFVTKATILNHSIGDGSKKIGAIKFLKIGKPFREYYQTRDCLYLLNESYSYIPLVYKIRLILQLTIRPILHIIFLDNKRERAYYIKLGFKHYRQGVNGSLRKDFLYKYK